MDKFDFSLCDTIGAALALVDNDYKLKNMLTVRRLQFYRCKQNKHDVYTDYIICLKAAAKEADVTAMSTDDVLALQMLCSCHDAELLKKLLEVEPCGALHLEECATTYETHKHTAGEIRGGSDSQRASKVESSGKKKYADITCYWCYRQGHTSRNCAMDRGKLKCSHCQTTGRHFTNDYCKTRQARSRRTASQN